MQAHAETLQPPATGLTVREATPQDADSCGRIFYDAFASIATRHNHPVEPTSREFTRFMVGHVIAHEGFTGLVAERSGELLGSAFVDERSVIAGVGPVTVDPTAQDGGVGRALMDAVLRREHNRGAAGVRLVQTAYHYRSLALYAKLGFTVREPLSVLQGTPPALSIPGLGVRAAHEQDLDSCNELCVRVHGHDRSRELHNAIAVGTAHVVEHPGGICGYATGFGYGSHAVAETNQHLIALLASAHTFTGLGILVPSRNADLLRWCLANGLKLVQQSTLMTTGLYNEPVGAWLASIAY